MHTCVFFGGDLPVFGVTVIVDDVLKAFALRAACLSLRSGPELETLFFDQRVEAISYAMVQLLS